MRKSLVIAAIAVAGVPAVALAAAPPEDGRDRAGAVRHAAGSPGHHAGGAPGRGGDAHAGRRGRGPALVARGDVARIDGGDGFTLRLTGGNRPLRRVVAGASELTVLLDVETAVDPFTTRIRVRGHGRAGVPGLAVGDRVVVTWRAARPADAAALGAIEAHRVVARAPRRDGDDDGSRDDATGRHGGHHDGPGEDAPGGHAGEAPGEGPGEDGSTAG